MESTLFTELTFTEQENLSGGKARNKIKVKQKNKAKVKQAGIVFGNGRVYNDADIDQRNRSENGINDLSE